MDDITLQATEEPDTPRDLRAQLFHTLSSQFAEVLESNGSLPVAAQEALVELLDSETTSAAQIIAAVSKNNPDDEEEDNE